MLVPIELERKLVQVNVVKSHFWMELHGEEVLEEWHGELVLEEESGNLQGERLSVQPQLVLSAEHERPVVWTLVSKLFFADVADTSELSVEVWWFYDWELRLVVVLMVVLVGFRLVLVSHVQSAPTLDGICTACACVRLLPSHPSR